MHYHSYNNTVTERVFDPYGLVCRFSFWYTVGYCHLRQELRTFRLDRILKVEMQDEEFTRPPNFDCLAQVLQSIPNTPAKWLVDVLLETTLEVAQQRVPPAVAVLEPVPDGVSFRCYVDRLDWMAYVLAGLHCPLVVRNPPELRDALRQLAQDIATKAERVP